MVSALWSPCDLPMLAGEEYAEIAKVHTPSTWEVLVGALAGPWEDDVEEDLVHVNHPGGPRAFLRIQ